MGAPVAALENARVLILAIDSMPLSVVEDYVEISAAVYTRGVFGAADALRHLISSGDVVMAPPDDPQRALAMLPAYQLGLFIALWLAAFAGLGLKRFGMGLGILALAAVGGVELDLVLGAGCHDEITHFAG